MSMNGDKIRKLEDLTDSRLLYEKDIPKFGYMLIILTSFLMFCVVIWSITAHKPYIVKADGIVQSDNKNYVMSKYTGEIVEINMKEGVLVEKGESLFKVKSSEIDVQLTQLQEQEKLYEVKKRQFQKLVKSIKEDKNYFDGTSQEDNLYYNQFELYKSQIEQNKVDVSSYKAYGYTDEQIEAQLIINEAKISEIYYNAIQAAENSIADANVQLEMINAQKVALGAGQREYVVTAPETGRVHLISEYKKGMVVQATTPIASIASEKDSYTIVANVGVMDVVKIHVGDKVDLEINGLAQSIYGTIGGEVIQIDSDLTIQNIEAGQQNAYFKAYIEPDISYLISNEGKKINITNGMAVEARIVYDELTYFDYVLETLQGVSR